MGLRIIELSTGKVIEEQHIASANKLQAMKALVKSGRYMFEDQSVNVTAAQAVVILNAEKDKLIKDREALDKEIAEVAELKAKYEALISGHNETKEEPVIKAKPGRKPRATKQ
jgi:predicted  nucleic acid-binding Zn-ribbon protein